MNSKTELVYGARCGSLSQVERLLGQGCSPNARDSDGYTAIYWAACKDHYQICDRLVAYGCDINMAVDSGATPLIAASDNGNLETVMHLLSHRGLNINQSNKRGDTALHMAAFRGYAHIVNALIAAGTDVLVTNMNGKMAIHEALMHGRKECVALLNEAMKRLSGMKTHTVFDLMSLHPQEAVSYPDVSATSAVQPQQAFHGQRLSTNVSNSIASSVCQDFTVSNRNQSNVSSNPTPTRQHRSANDMPASSDWSNESHQTFARRDSQFDSSSSSSCEMSRTYIRQQSPHNHAFGSFTFGSSDSACCLGNVDTSRISRLNSKDDSSHLTYDSQYNSLPNDVLSGDLSSCSSSSNVAHVECPLSHIYLNTATDQLALISVNPSQCDASYVSSSFNNLTSRAPSEVTQCNSHVVFKPNVSETEVLEPPPRTEKSNREPTPSSLDDDAKVNDGNRSKLASATIGRFVEDLQMKVLELEGKLSHAKSCNSKLYGKVSRLTVENAGLKDENSKLKYTVGVLLSSKSQNSTTNSNIG